MKFTAKNILNFTKTTRYTVVKFDRASGKRIATVGNCNPIRALHELSFSVQILDTVVLLLPQQDDETWIRTKDMTLEQGLKMAVTSVNLY